MPKIPRRVRTELMQGDCLELMKYIPDGSVDMVLTDPPYGITNNKWDSVIDLETMWKELKRVTKKSGAIVMTASQPFTTTLIASNIRMFKYTWVWDKKNPTGFLNAKKQPLRVSEDVVVFYLAQPSYTPEMVVRGKPRVKGGCSKPGGSDNYGGMLHDVKTLSNEYYPTNILPISNANRKEKTHPTQKPVTLMEYLIKTYTRAGDVVLDFAMGSGTTGVAAKNINRSFIGIELDPDIFTIAKTRIENS